MPAKLVSSLLLPLGLLLGCAALPAADPGVVSGGRYEAVQRKVSALVRSRMAANGVVGLALSLVDDQDVVWAQGFGFADKEKRKPATQDTIFATASVTKLFTATAVMQLVEQGRIALDAPLAASIPEFSVNTRFPPPRPSLSGVS